jgi:transcriptional regulator with XRE-family HTH domain
VNHNDDIELFDTHSLMEEFVFDDDGSVREYLRQEWLEGIFAQLIEARVAAGLSQTQLGERLGKPQSSIARMERGADMKLSVLWDYLAALDKTPQSTLALEDLSDVEARLRKYYTRQPQPKPILRSKNWLDVPKPGELIARRQYPHEENLVPSVTESSEPDQKDQAA